jgi:N-acetylgalactosamine-6-sulfatase
MLLDLEFFARRIFSVRRILRLPALAVLCGAAAAPAAPGARPNIVLLLADDLGYGDLACYGGQAVPTPAIDALAAAGTRFTRAYAASAVCTPTRASLLTGKYPLRFGITRAFPDGPEHLPRSTVTLPRRLQQAGYATAHVGKWHLGGLHAAHAADRAHAPPGPREHGFDHYLAMIEAPEPRGRLVRSSRLFRDGAKVLLRDDAAADLSPTHLTEVQIAESERLIATFAARAQPFFLNVWFDVPHKPYEEAPPSITEPLRRGAQGDELRYRSMLGHLDHAVGRIVAQLRTLGLAENTLVLFTSDNGPTGPGRAGPWRGGKGTLFEGGIRVPFIAAWPGRIPAGRTSAALVHSADVLPTVCAATGVPLPAGWSGDGANLLPFLLGRAPPPARGTIFWQLDPYPTFHRERAEPPPHATEVALRGDWKLLAHGAVPLALYDLAQEPAERHDRLAEQPALAAELAAQVKAWLAEPRVPRE